MTKKILVGLSGGVDSAVSAYLLKEQGYEVACGFMINYLDEDNPECTTRADLDMAKRVADFLKLPLYTFDYREEYERRIIDYIYREYERGRTPNPDVFCNNLVKFDLFLDEALTLGYDAIATGHYARIHHPERQGQGDTSQIQNDQVVELLKGIDPQKDQSYFLSRLSPSQLSRAIFPIGGLLKSEVRAIAKKAGLPNADRKDSQGLCFIGKVPMQDFLARKLERKEGKILSTDGKILGTHDGAFSYTIGQRKGIKVGGGPALFVVAKDTVANTIMVGTADELALFSLSCTLTDWVGALPTEGRPYTAKIRYRQEDQDCTCHCEDFSYPSDIGRYSPEDEGLSDILDRPASFAITIRFKSPQRAIASGQICVVYDGDRVLGSGVIA